MSTNGDSPKPDVRTSRTWRLGRLSVTIDTTRKPKGAKP